MTPQFKFRYSEISCSELSTAMNIKILTITFEKRIKFASLEWIAQIYIIFPRKDDIFHQENARPHVAFNLKKLQTITFQDKS